MSPCSCRELQKPIVEICRGPDCGGQAEVTPGVVVGEMNAVAEPAEVTTILPINDSLIECLPAHESEAVIETINYFTVVLLVKPYLRLSMSDFG